MMENFAKFVVGLGVVLVTAGLFMWLAADKLNWLGQLPGDIKLERPGFRFYMPITTMILLSAALSFVIWLFGKFFH